jgi:PAS domain S-box-containing protein
VLHKLLARQLRKLSLESGILPSQPVWPQFLDLISETYDAVDQERRLIQHSIDIASIEMQDLNISLVNERDKFASIFRATPSGMAITDPEGNITDINSAFEATLDCGREQLIGKPVLTLVEAVDAGAFKATLANLSTCKISSSRQRLRIISSRREPVLAEIHCTAALDAQGKTQMLLIVIEDVTERTRLEVELRHSLKLESVGRLAAGIAHEINTPIQFVGDTVKFLSTAFNGLISLCRTYRSLSAKAVTAVLSPEDVKRQKVEEDAADFENVRDNIPSMIVSTIHAIARVSKIVQSMKAFSHPDQGQRTNADINAALRDTLIVATNELKHVATIETGFGEIPRVPCFLSDLNQVFLNLLVNAAHAIADVVGKSEARGVIKVRTYQEETNIVIEISDTGTGIPKAVQSRIFDPFFTTKGMGKGTGQGLALAHSVVVEQHGGTIKFETEMGKGTTFFVRIPLQVATSKQTE